MLKFRYAIFALLLWATPFVAYAQNANQVPNLATFRANAYGGTVWLAGYVTPGDGGQGYFLPNGKQSVTHCVDNGTTVIVDKNGTCWDRQSWGGAPVSTPSMITVPTIAALENIGASAGASVTAAYVPGIGIYQWNATSTATPDPSDTPQTIVQVTGVTTGRMVLQNGAIGNVANIAALEALPDAPIGMTVNVGGYTTPGDGGGGMFTVISGTLSASDGGTTFFVSNSAGGTYTDRYWQRKFSLSVSPMWFGCAGNGTTNDTTCITNMIAADNANGWNVDGGGKTYLMSYNNGTSSYAVTASGIKWSNITLKGDPTTSGADLIVFSGTNVTLYNFHINGNQAAMASSSFGSSFSCLGMGGTADYMTIMDSSVDYCNSDGLKTGYGANQSLGVIGLKISNSDFSYNADTGIETYGLSQFSFSHVTLNDDGLGFQHYITYPYPYQHVTGVTDIGGCIWMRYQTHDGTLEDVQAYNCGRDGIAFDQGSHDITVTSSGARFSGDGGITFNADNNGTGDPGEGQCEWNITLNGDTAMGNYAGGLVETCAVQGLDVNGGRYYDNDRSAGTIAEATNAWPNIYIAGNSTNITLNGPRAFDDRQGTSVTGAATGGGPYTIPVTAWTIGTWQFYPKVAFYNGSGTFEGYCQLSAETSTSITCTPTTYNGVPPASIASGWYVTQRVSLAGAFIDSYAEGQGYVLGGGFLPGPDGAPLQGCDLCGSTINPVNFAVTGHLTGLEILSNPTMDANVTGWTADGVHSSITFDGTPTDCLSVGCGKISSDGAGFVDAATISGNYLGNPNGQWVRFKIDVDQPAAIYTSSTGSRVCIYIGSSGTCKDDETSGWKTVAITSFIPSGASLTFRFFAASGIDYIDNASVQVVEPQWDSDSVPMIPPSYLPN